MLVSNLPILYINSSPLNYKGITLLRLLEPSNDKCMIIQLRVNRTVEDNDKPSSEKVAHKLY